jgi:hypothetical protein
MIVEQFELILLVLGKISALDLFQDFIDFLALEFLVRLQNIDSLEVRMILREGATVWSWDTTQLTLQICCCLRVLNSKLRVVIKNLVQSLHYLFFEQCHVLTHLLDFAKNQ